MFDLGYLIRGSRSAINSSSQVIIVEHGPHTIGLLVDELHAVPQFGPAQIIHTPLVMQGQSMLVSQVIKANGGKLLIQAIDIARLFAWVVDGSIPQAPSLELVERITAAPAGLSQQALLAA